VVKKKRKRKAAKATLAFDITAAEAKHPVMQNALKTGVAKSLGLEAASVSIISVDGVAVAARQRQRRLAIVNIEFQILSSSDDAAEADQLKQNLEAAAQDGAIVANVQEAANDKKILVQSLKDMALEMTKPKVEVSETEVEVAVQVSTDTDTDTDPVLSSGSTHVLSAVAVMGVGVASLMLL
jgi:hypothetical protein